MARDYRKEYVRRIEKATAKGYTRAEATGHANIEEGHIPVSIRNALSAARPNQAARAVFKDLSQEQREEIFQQAKLNGLLERKKPHEMWSKLLGSP